MKKRLIPLVILLIAALAGYYFFRERTPQGAAAPHEAPPGMAWIPGGQFTMGSDDPMAWEEEKPAHKVKVRGFWMDVTEVTNAVFARFAEATLYVTDAEKAPSLEEVMAQVPPGTPPPDPKDMVAGGLVFQPTTGPVNTDDITQWWRWQPGADWRHPEGPGSTITGREQHPVVMISWNDAQAYCKWAGKRLPTEAEWEFAARGSLEGKNFVWGNEAPTDDKVYANTWQGHFPDKNTKKDGFDRTAPVKSFAANGYGLYDMAGNVWEWCNDWYDKLLYQTYEEDAVSDNPPGPAASRDPAMPYTPLRVQKGGSFLCHDSYCQRYRPSARQASSPESGMSHVGFRCVKDAP
ncbi:MAG: SUMF1/EgtB/PvdO family nonheme iron enzyme [Flavihumibacter sp.]